MTSSSSSLSIPSPLFSPHPPPLAKKADDATQGEERSSRHDERSMLLK